MNRQFRSTDSVKTTLQIRSRSDIEQSMEKIDGGDSEVNDVQALVEPQSRSGILTQWLPELTLLFTAGAWGLNIVFLKYAVSNANPWIFSAPRLTIAAIVLTFLVWIFSKKHSRTISFGTFFQPRILAFSLLNGFGYHAMMLLGVPRTTAGNTALLMSSMPMWTALLSAVFLKEKLSAWMWAGMGIAAAGTGLVVSQTLDFSLQRIAGNGFVIGGALSWAASAVVSRPLLKEYSPLQLAMIASLTTVPIHVLIAVFQFVYLQQSVPTEPKVWLVALYSGSVATGIAYATWHYGVQALGASHASIYQNLVTVVAVVGGFFLLAEPIFLTQILGGATIVLGLLLGRVGRKSK